MKILGNITVTIFTFILSLTLVAFWNFIFPPIPEIGIPDQEQISYCQFAPIETSVCQLWDFPDEYDDKWITIDARAIFSDGQIRLLDPHGCSDYKDVNIHNGEIERILSPALDLDGSDGKYDNLKKKLIQKKEVRLRIIGTIKKTHVTFRHIRFQQYAIFPEYIQIVSKLKEYEPDGAA